jgi:cobyrinic acid a,c-diamide synthase
MTASYVHFYFPSNPRAIAALFAPDPEAAIANRLAPTSDHLTPVGASLLAKRS